MARAISVSKMSLPARRKLIIDTDCGVDDAEAIIFALSRERLKEWDVLGITCVSGNTPLENVYGNVLRVLKLCQQEQIPVYAGAESALLGKYGRVGHSAHVHGSDGFGGVADQYACDMSLLKEERAADFLIRSVVKDYPGEVTLVTLGPLTNIALALRLNSNFGDKLKRLCIMGGNHEGRGNITTSAEFNFAFDPESAFVALNEIKCPISVVTWETCISHGLSWSWYESWLSANSLKADLIRKMTSDTAKRRKNLKNAYHSCDLWAMVAFLCPEVIEKIWSTYMTVELAGNYARGQCIVDVYGHLESKANVDIVVKLDVDKLGNLCKSMF